MDLELDLGVDVPDVDFSAVGQCEDLMAGASSPDDSAVFVRELGLLREIKGLLLSCLSGYE